MPYAKNGDVNINYKLAGEGIPLILVHGGGADLTFWKGYGYIDALKSDYQLISIDLRGHGQSDKPHDHAAYERDATVEDVMTVIDDIGLKKAHYLGFSLGALIGYFLATRHAERFLSFTLMDMNPLAFPEANIQGSLQAIKLCKALMNDPETAVKELEKQWKHSFTPEEKARFLARDSEALAIAMEAQLDWEKISESDLSQIALPCLIMGGELDPWAAGSEEVSASIPNAQYVFLPGLNHTQVWESSEVTLPHIKEFLVKVTK